MTQNYFVIFQVKLTADIHIPCTYASRAQGFVFLPFYSRISEGDEFCITSVAGCFISR